MNFSLLGFTDLAGTQIISLGFSVHSFAAQAWVEVLFYEQVASVRSSLVFPILRIKIYLAFHNKSYLIVLKQGIVVNLILLLAFLPIIPMAFSKYPLITVDGITDIYKTTMQQYNSGFAFRVTQSAVITTRSSCPATYSPLRISTNLTNLVTLNLLSAPFLTTFILILKN